MKEEEKTNINEISGSRFHKLTKKQAKAILRLRKKRLSYKDITAVVNFRFPDLDYSVYSVHNICKRYKLGPNDHY